MRLAVKSVLAILVFYVVLLGGISLWLEYKFSSLATALVRNTARLIGNEIAGVVSGAALDRLVKGERADRDRLAEIVARVTEESDVVDSLAVVDKSGKVVAGDQQHVGRQLTPPQVLFAERERVELSSPNLLKGGDYHLFVALTAQEEVVGYLRLSIRSQRIVRLYRQTRRELAYAAGIAFIGAALVGLIIHFGLTRRLGQLTRILEGVSRGDVLPISSSQDEFADALNVARRVGRELSAAREEKSQATRRLGALLKAMDVGVLLVKKDGGLEFASATACELFSCRTQVELEERWHDLARDLLAPFGTDSARACAEGARRDVELQGADGVRRLRLDCYRLEDQEEGFLVLIKDREMMETLERELGLAIQMRGLARFYGALAHDLRAPLNAMVMNLELLRQTVAREEEIDPERRERQLRYVRILQEEVARFDRQLKSLLSHAAPPREGKEPLDLRDLVRDLAALLDPQARHQRVEVTTRVPERPLTMIGHGDRLKQALLNVLINALEAMPEGGALAIELAARNGAAEVAIRDTGPGIEPELRRKIFEMSFTTKTGGNGVGLFVTRSIVESHGGEVRIEDAAGGGTQFRISFPLRAEGVD